MSWHYTQGLYQYLQTLLKFLQRSIRFFSLPLLFQGLFYPYKRLVSTKKKSGFSFSELADQISYNLVSRLIGFFIRLNLIFACLLSLLVITFFWILGLFAWILLPIVGTISWRRHRQDARFILEDINHKLNQLRDQSKILQVIFDNPAGRFVLRHTTIPSAQIPAPFHKPQQKFFQYEQLLNWYFSQPDENDRLHDLVLAAHWWDQLQVWKEESRHSQSPGIGSELLFGFTPNLNNFVEDMGQKQSFSQNLIGRQGIVKNIERVLSSSKSVFLIGEPGVGKRTVVYEFAKRAKHSELGLMLAFSRVLYLDYNAVLAGEGSLNEKKSRLDKIFTEAAAAGNVILVLKDLHRLVIPEIEGWDFVDVLEEAIEDSKLKIIALTTPVEYERFLAPQSRLGKYFKPVEIDPVSKQDALKILFNYVSTHEKKIPAIIAVEVLKSILEISDKYITETPFPEKAIELLNQLIAYARQNQINQLTVADVNKLASELTGIPVEALTEQQKVKLTNIEQFIHQFLVNQESAVDLIGRSLRSRASGIKQDIKPVGSFLFLGPTGVGKTQTARALAEAYYGSQDKIIRFDMAAYANEEGLGRLIGFVEKQEPGEMTTAIKNNPASLLLLDEIEKAPRQIVNLLLTLLDEGYLVDALNKKIDCRHLFLIATSNAAAEDIRQLVASGLDQATLQAKTIEIVQKKGYFSAEFLNRFDGVVVYKPLQKADLLKVAAMQLDRLLKKMAANNVKLNYDQQVLARIVDKGYNPSFGARPMQRVIDLEIGDILSKGLLENQIDSHDEITLSVDEEGNFTWHKK